MSVCSVSQCEKPYALNGYCQMHHWRLKHYGDPHYVRPVRLCSVGGCNRKHKAHGLCERHACRQKRGIPLNYTPRALAKKRYRIVTRFGHPIANVRGRIYEHRLVFHDAIGGSRVPCFWCGTPLEWGKNLVVDHLNHDRHDNSLENLVPSCNSCNIGRTSRNSHVRTSVYTPGVAA